MQIITNFDPPASLANSGRAPRTAVRVGLVQHAWRPGRGELERQLNHAVGIAVENGAQAVFLPELTLSRYPAFVRAGANPGEAAEDLVAGPTFSFAARAAKEFGVLVHASLYERAEGEDGRGFNTAILVGPDGELLGRTRKLHIPVSPGYYEDTYFRPGPAEDPYPVYRPDVFRGVGLGMPTCWDEWFPEVSRAYSLAGAGVLVYPTAIGSEPTHPDFDTRPLWQQVIVANGITAGTFMIVPNRTGDEGELTFYGSSFISDPYGRILVQASRDEEAVLIADLDLSARRDWLDLFPFLTTRRPDTYGSLTAAVDLARPYGAGQEEETG